MRPVACWVLLLLPHVVTGHGEGEDVATLSYEELLAVTSKQKNTIAALQRENQRRRDRLEKGGCTACWNLSRPASVSRVPADSRRLRVPKVDRGCLGLFKWGAISLTNPDNIRLFSSRNCEVLFSEIEPGRVVIGENLTDLSPLRSWRIIHGDLRIQNTRYLRSLEGLGNLSSISGILMLRNNSENLTDISALQGVRQTGPIDIVSNPGLVTLEGLHNVETVVGAVVIRNNSRLEDLTGMANLQRVGGALTISKNPTLKSLLGLGKLELAGVMQVIDNKNMQYLGGPFCQSQSVGLKSLRFIDESEDACDPDRDPPDAFPRCVTPSEWQALGSAAVQYTDDSGAPVTPKNWNCSAWERQCNDLDHWRKSRGRGIGRCKEGPACGPNPVVCLWQQPCRIRVRDLNVSYRGRVFCPSCGSCGSCTGENNIQVLKDNGIIDVQALLQDRAPGNYTLCRCGDELGPLVPIELHGARKIRQTLCSMGVPCRIEAQFDADAFINSKIWLVPVGRGCAGERDDPKISGEYTDGGSVMFSAENLSQSLRPGDYEVCWKPYGNGYTARVITTAVKIRGPFFKEREDEHDVGEPNLEIRYDGLGFSNEFCKTSLVKDIMRLVPVQQRSEQNPCGRVSLYDVRSVNGSFNFRFSVSYPGWFAKCWCYNETSSCVNTGFLHIVCSAGTVEASLARGRCEPCPIGKKFEPGREECALHGDYWWLFGLQHLSLFWALFLLLVQLGMPIRIADTFTSSGELYAETAYPHQLHCYGRRSFPVLFTSTRNANLDTPWVPLRALPNTVQSLRILAENGEPIPECWDTSHGFVQLPLWHGLWHKGWPLPAAVQLLLTFAFYIGVLILSVEQKQMQVASVLTGAAGALGLALTLRVLSRWYSRSESLTELDRHIISFRKRLRRKNPKPVACEKGPSRAVALSELFDIWEHFQTFIRERNAYYMDTNILGPLTKPDQLSYAEMAGPALVRFYVSHHWGNNFHDLCKTLKKHAETVCASAGEDDLWKEEKYWICFVSNNQYRLDDEIGSGWDKSSFFLTLQSGHCKGVCLVLDNLAAPLTRAWCIFELLQTLLLEEKTGLMGECVKLDGFMGLLLCTEGGVLNEGEGSAEVTINLVERICHLDLEKADASVAKDKEMIHKQVVESLGSFKKMNAKVRQKFDLLLRLAKRQQDNRLGSVYQVLRAALKEDGELVALDDDCSLGLASASVALDLDPDVPWSL